MAIELVGYVAVAVAALVALALAVAGIEYVLRFCAHLFAMPGVVVHEFAHATACRAVGVPVLEVRYFRFDDPPGYVRHVNPDRYRQSIVISVAPFLVNTVVAFGAFLGVAMLASTVVGLQAGSLETLADPRAVPTGTLVDVLIDSIGTVAAGAVLSWVGLSVGMRAFPSTIDARTLWKRSRAEWRRSPVVLLGIPIVFVIYAVNLLSRLWAHLFYALGLGVAACYLVWMLAI